MKSTPHFETARSRRDFLLQAGGGLGAVALTHLLAGESLRGEPLPGDSALHGSSLAPKTPHHRPRAKSIIWLFMEGGPSHIDFFDPKPLVNKLAGQVPAGELQTGDSARRTRGGADLAESADLETIRPKRHVGLQLAAARRRDRR